MIQIYERKTGKRVPIERSAHLRDSDKIVLYTCDLCGKDTPNKLNSENHCHECIDAQIN